MKTVSLVLLAVFGVSAGLSADLRGAPDRTNWLIGTWETRSPRGSLFEEWSRLNKDELSGRSYFIRDGDTVVVETIRLVSEGENLFYIPTVRDQNDGLPVRFSLRSISDTSFVFENPSHDYPQRISYTRISADSLIAEIAGTRGGEERSQRFPMGRVAAGGGR